MTHKTSVEAARDIWEHLNSTMAARTILELPPTIERVELLEPNRENTDWANAAIVIHMANGDRFGLEVCPFPELPSPLRAGG